MNTTDQSPPFPTEPEGQWQTMDTAPTDGTLVEGKWGNRRIAQTAFLRGTWTIGNEAYFAPDYWRPLPSPQTGSGSGSGTPETDAFFDRKPSGRSFLCEVKEKMAILETRLRTAEGTIGQLSAELEKEELQRAHDIGEAEKLIAELRSEREEAVRLSAKHFQDTREQASRILRLEHKNRELLRKLQVSHGSLPLIDTSATDAEDYRSDLEKERDEARAELAATKQALEAKERERDEALRENKNTWDAHGRMYTELVNKTSDIRDLRAALSSARAENEHLCRELAFEVETRDRNAKLCEEARVELEAVVAWKEEINGAIQRSGLGILRTSQGPVGTMICTRPEVEEAEHKKVLELIHENIDLELKLSATSAALEMALARVRELEGER